MNNLINQAVAHQNAGRLREAEAIYRNVLARQPNNDSALHLLGVLAHQVKRHDDGVALIGQAIAINPNIAMYHSNLGLALLHADRPGESIVACQQALRLQPDSRAAMVNLSLALRKAGRGPEAVNLYRQVLAHNPRDIDIRNRLANALFEAGQNADAIAVCRQTLTIAPNDPNALCALGSALTVTEQLDESIAVFERALATKPDFGDAWCGLARSLKDAGRIEECVEANRQAVRLIPDNASIHSNYLFALQFHPKYDARMILAEHRRFDEIHAKPLAKFIRPHGNAAMPGRRLRVGYVSPDFRAHSSTLFTLPLLAAHDRANVQVFCYADVPQPDSLTDAVRQHADAWRNIVGLPDAQVAEMIRQDGIDILVDLAMHMGRGRPLLFARKPAPVQVAWLAYPGTTGLSAMDYRLTDPYLDPPGMHDDLYSEQSIRLPDTFWCFKPITTGPPVNETPPAVVTGQITFGCFNNFCKINDGVAALWAAVLRAAPNSRLIVQTSPGSHRDRLRRKMADGGVADERLDFVPRMAVEDYLALYHRIDISLDTFPYNGHTTSLESLWMGVPVVSLCGNNVACRAGLCQLSHLGLTDLVADTDEQYIDIATKLSADLPRLWKLRSTLRPAMEKSPLMDSARFARNMEAAYRTMWGKWCESQATR